MSELKPCPFDGMKAVLHRDSGNERIDQRWWVQCSECKVNGRMFFGSNTWAVNKKEDAAAESSAIEWWNRRAPASEGEKS